MSHNDTRTRSLLVFHAASVKQNLSGFESNLTYELLILQKCKLYGGVMIIHGVRFVPILTSHFKVSAEAKTEAQG